MHCAFPKTHSSHLHVGRRHRCAYTLLAREVFLKPAIVSVKVARTIAPGSVVVQLRMYM
jgi:hypothetical protein